MRPGFAGMTGDGNRDRIEFYVGGISRGMIAVVESSHAPAVGEAINIRKKTYVVASRSWALDQADRANERSLACVIILEEEKP